MFFNNFPTLGRVATTDNLDWWDGSRLRNRIKDRVDQFDGRLGPNDKVLLGHGGSAEFVADLLAIWSVGAAAACINPTLTANEIETLKDFMEPAAGIFSPDTDPEYYSVKKKSAASIHLDNPALFLFTSGTTGNPKGVEHSFRSLAARLSLNQIYIDHESLQKTLCPLPTHFGHGLIGNLLTPLFAGGDVLLLGDKSPMGLAKLGQIIDTNNIRFLSSVPSFWKMVTKLSKPPQKGTLKRVHVGSDPPFPQIYGKELPIGREQNKS